MANCSTCGRDVGCSCNLIDGICTRCYANNSHMSPSLVPVSTGVFSPIMGDETGGFTSITNDYTLSQEEKVRRINEILNNAKLNINDSQI